MEGEIYPLLPLLNATMQGQLRIVSSDVVQALWRNSHVCRATTAFYYIGGLKRTGNPGMTIFVPNPMTPRREDGEGKGTLPLVRRW